MSRKVRRFLAEEVGWLPFLYATVYSAKAIGVALWPVDLVSYLALAIFSIVVLSKGIKFDSTSLLFAIYIPISILIDRPSAFFSPWQRCVLFLLLMICVSPLVCSQYAMRFRKGVFKMTLAYCVLISAISFFCYFVGINLMKNSLSGVEMGYLINKAGTFSGITAHSMLLGPISGIASVTCAYFALTQRRKKVYVCLAIICFGSLLFSASRSALLASLAGIVSLLWFQSRRHGRVAKYAVVSVLLGMATYPIWQGALDGINAKNQGSISVGLNTSSREEKWQIRIEEFKDSPVTGIGFASVSDRDYYAFNGTIEPGSSWLAVLSMTGLIGFSLFLLIYAKATKSSLLTYNPTGALLGAILVLLGVHMMAEGHVFSAGSFLCYCVWLAIGCCTDYGKSRWSWSLSKRS